MTKLRLLACLLLAAASLPAVPRAHAQARNDGRAPPSPSDSPAPPPPDAASFDTDTYSCQNVLDDLAAGRQSQIGIAVVVTYAQLRARTTPDNHQFSMAEIQKVASAAGADCASGDHKRLLRAVVAEQMSKPKP